MRPASAAGEWEEAMERFLRVADGIYRLCIWISGTAIVIMSLIIPWGVYARKFLGRGASWPEPVAIVCMVIFTFFGAAVTYRACGHIAVDLLVSRFAQGTQRVLSYVVDVLLILISLFMVFYGFSLCRVTWNQSVDAIPALSVGVTYLPLPLGSLVLMLFIVEHMIAGAQKDRPIVAFGQVSAENSSLQ
jgi:TRAP-type C4-dicarboxylate transport system permease small subunit